jgi:hypothetical protein
MKTIGHIPVARVVHAALVGLLAACGPSPQPPLATTVCELPAHAQRSVQFDATVSVDSEGQAFISDARCTETRIMLRLSTAASRAGAAGQLQAAAQQAVSAGHTSFPVRVTGVYTSTPSEASFVAESVTAAVPPGRE